MDTSIGCQERNVSIEVVKRDSCNLPAVRLGGDELTVFEWQRLKGRVDGIIWEHISRIY